nr:MAG TPA: hypothetical protein [Caudoviricetes sp.]DAW53038.1 MAG TPA: hypothetical protein [Caudoviricetes sp.]
MLSKPLSMFVLRSFFICFNVITYLLTLQR